MKKTALIVAAVLLAAGLALGFAAFASAGFNLTWFKGEPAEVKNYPVEESFDRIEIEEDTSDIRFARSDDGKARVECRETKKSAHTVTAENGVLKIQRQKITGWKNLITFSFEKTVVTVYLPETAYESLAIDTHTGDTDIPEDDIAARIFRNGCASGAFRSGRPPATSAAARRFPARFRSSPTPAIFSSTTFPRMRSAAG